MALRSAPPSRNALQLRIAGCFFGRSNLLDQQAPVPGNGHHLAFVHFPNSGKSGKRRTVSLAGFELERQLAQALEFGLLAGEVAQTTLACIVIADRAARDLETMLAAAPVHDLAKAVLFAGLEVAAVAAAWPLAGGEEAGFGVLGDEPHASSPVSSHQRGDPAACTW